MKALIFEQIGDYKEVLKFKEVEEPSLNSRQVKIFVRARPVNPSDFMFIKGVYRRQPVFPQTAGLEGSGVIIETGAAVQDFKKGDHVAFRAPGTWAEKVVVDEQSLIKINQDLPFEVSCQIPLNGMTAIALLKESVVKPGEVLLINAANSSLSGLIIQLAVLQGISVFALVRDLSHSDQILNWGAKQVFGQNDPSFWDNIDQHLKGIRFNGFIDMVGGELLSRVLPHMAQFANIVVCGNMSNGQKASISNDTIIYKNLTIKGFGIDRWLSCAGSNEVRTYYSNMVEELARGRLQFRKTALVALGSLALEQNEKVIIQS